MDERQFLPGGFEAERTHPRPVAYRPSGRLGARVVAFFQAVARARA